MAYRFLLLFGALALVACDRRSNTTTTSGEAPASSFDRQFIDMMVAHHEQAVMMNDMAKTKAEHPQLRALAARSSADQTAEIDQMRSRRKAWFPNESPPAPAAMPMLPGMAHDPSLETGEMHRTLEAAKPFDRAFIDLMIKHHRSGMDAAKRAIESATHPELKSLAQKMLDEQAKEIAELEGYERTWYSTPK